ncbi:MAG: hypothetical protein ACJA1U_001547 [Bermanella sp.]|jgi:uncharacterized protein YccT (UPF0319 family)
MRSIFLLIILFIQGCSTAQQVRLYDGPAIGHDQEVQLILPLNFELLSLDGQEVAQFNQTFRNHDLNIKLTAGLHTLVMRYNDLFQIDADNHQTLTTGQITFTATFKAGEVLRIQTPPLGSLRQAQQFIANPSVNLVSDHQVIPGSHIDKEDPLAFKKDDEVQTVSYPNLKQLQFWWLKASDYEKAQFKRLISPPTD